MSVQSTQGKRGILVASGLLALAFALLATVLAPSSAQAHNICVNHPEGSTTVCVRDGSSWHTLVDVCDRQADGNSVYARAVVWGHAVVNGSYMITGYDTNGSAAGCSTYNLWQTTVTGFAGTFQLSTNPFAVCVQNEGCSLWKFDDGSLSGASYPAYQPGGYHIPKVA